MNIHSVKRNREVKTVSFCDIPNGVEFSIAKKIPKAVFSRTEFSYSAAGHFISGCLGGAVLDVSSLSVAFLVGRDTDATRLAIQSVAALPGVRIAGVLIDSERPIFASRRKNLRRNIRRDGWTYPATRALDWANAVLDRMAAGVVDHNQAKDLLRVAFPERSFSLRDLSDRCGFPVYEVGNLNSTRASDMLRHLSVDLGIVLGTRILKRTTFAVPRLGSVNLHKGKVPEYRGMPPGFWELYDGSATAGVTVHFVEDKLDAGDVIGSREFTIHKNETESSLRYKLDLEGSRLLAECVDAVRQGTAAAIPQPQYSGKPRTIPSHRQREELRRRIPQAPQETGLRQLAKTVVHLSLYYGGVYSAVRGWRSLTRRSRAVVLLYHRVNDFSDDALTVSTERFAEHLSLFREKYELRSTSWLVDALRSGTRIPPRTLVIHFDDCYADVLHQGGRLLRAWDMPATAFIASGYVGTNRVFEHDAKKYPFQYPNFTPDEVRSLPACGFEVGAHTVNHVNLGEVSLEDAHLEVTESRLQLEAILGRQVRFFSFPWGRLHNIREEIRPIVRSAGYDAMFAADGGFVAGSTDLYDIPRCGASSKHRPLDLMMELEGLSSSGIVGRLRRLLRPYRKAVGASGEQPVAQQAAETTAE